jgi:hypothetical protein
MLFAIEQGGGKTTGNQQESAYNTDHGPDLFLFFG